MLGAGAPYQVGADMGFLLLPRNLDAMQQQQQQQQQGNAMIGAHFSACVRRDQPEA